MPVAGGGFEQCYHAHAVVAAGSLLVVATDVVQAPNDKQQVAPMLRQIGALPAALGAVDTLLADTGYFSAGNVEAGDAAGIEPAIATVRVASRDHGLERQAHVRPRPRPRLIGPGAADPAGRHADTGPHHSI